MRINHYSTLAFACALTLFSSAFAQQEGQLGPKSASAPVKSRVCANENGVTVCRDTDLAPVKTLETVGTAGMKSAPPVATSAAKQGRLLFLLDIPTNIFSRLSDDPARNREFHPKQSWNYRPEAPAPPRASEYRPMVTGAAPVWKYKPKTSFEYRPKRNWNYDRDVFGRVWRENIQNDTRVVTLPIEQPGVYLLPVGSVP